PPHDFRRSHSFLLTPRPPRSPLFPYTTLFRSLWPDGAPGRGDRAGDIHRLRPRLPGEHGPGGGRDDLRGVPRGDSRNPPQWPPDCGDPRVDGWVRGDDVPRYRVGLSLWGLLCSPRLRRAPRPSMPPMPAPP